MSTITTTHQNPNLEQTVERLLILMIAVISPLLLIGLLEAAYSWGAKSGKGSYAWSWSLPGGWWRSTPSPEGYTLMEP
jgi:hypothetical protein